MIIRNIKLFEWRRDTRSRHAELLLTRERFLTSSCVIHTTVPERPLINVFKKNTKTDSFQITLSIGLFYAEWRMYFCFYKEKRLFSFDETLL